MRRNGRTGRMGVSARALVAVVVVLLSSAVFWLSSAYRAAFNYDEARRTLRRTAEKHPRSARPWVTLGELDLQLQHYDDAIKELKRAVVLKPAEAAAHVDLGVAYDGSGKPDPAL